MFLLKFIQNFIDPLKVPLRKNYNLNSLSSFAKKKKKRATYLESACKSNFETS